VEQEVKSFTSSILQPFHFGYSDSTKKVAGSVVELTSTSSHGPKKGMVLPFQPLSLAFNNVNYYVDMPAVSNCVSYLFSLYRFTNAPLVVFIVSFKFCRK